MSAGSVAEVPAIRPTLANWYEHPNNRWAFRHVRELVPSARVSARRPLNLIQGPAEPPLTPQAQALLDRTFTDAFVVLREGVITHEWYAPGVRSDDRHILFSVTKSVTALVVGALAGQSVLDVDRHVADYVPELEQSGFGSATLRQLLDMTAGVRFVEDYDGPDMRRYRQAAGLLPSADSRGLHAFLADLPSDGRHGAQFRYRSPYTDMLGWVCERVSGKSFAELIADNIWQPMGAEADADLLIDAFGAPRTGGGLCATARDMARIGQLLIDGGRGSIPAWFISDLTSAGDEALWAAGEIAELLPGGAYRSCWYQPRQDPDVVMAVGIYGQWIYVDIPRHVVVVKQSSGATPTDPAVDREVIALLREIAAAAASA
jgi:CubicO group peptidase (beta-lactamase class C family)